MKKIIFALMLSSLVMGLVACKDHKDAKPSTQLSMSADKDHASQSDGAVNKNDDHSDGSMSNDDGQSHDADMNDHDNHDKDATESEDGHEDADHSND